MRKSSSLQQSSGWVQHFNQVIKLTGERSLSAAVSDNIERLMKIILQSNAHPIGFLSQNFRTRETDSSDDNESNPINPASPNFLLAYDLASDYSDLIEIDRNINSSAAL